MLPAFFAALLGCCPSVPGAGAVEDSGAPTFVAEHEPTLDAAGFAAAFDAVLAAGFPLPQTVFADYRELLGHGDGSCPAPGGSEYFDVPQGCTTGDGFTFRGHAGVMVSDSRVYSRDGSWTGAFAQFSDPADYSITRPDGTGLQAGGILETLVMQEGGVTTWSAAMAGTFLDEGQPDWLGDTFSGGFDLAGSGTGDAAAQTVDGELSIGAVALGFEALELSPGTCPTGAIGGALSLRQSDATWFTLTLADGCGACGSLVWNGVDQLGEACVNLVPVLDTVAIVSAL